MPRTVAALMLLPTLAHAADTTETLARERGRGGVWAGAAVTRGQLDYEAPTARVSTRLDALPAVAFGADLWPEEAIGLYAALSVGLGADLELPTGGALRYSAHQLEAGARYRWFLGPRRDALAVVAGLGMRGLRQTVQVQRPAFLVDSTTVGPELSAAVEVPLGWMWVRGGLRAGLPFFVREAPADSGDPQGYLALGGRAEAVVRLGGPVSAQLAADVARQTLDFRGEGTRAAGVDGGRAEDFFTTLTMGARLDL